MAHDKNTHVEMSNTNLNGNYTNLLDEIKSILNNGLYSAYKAVDNIKVQTYWQVGERIVREELKYKDRAEYGQFMVKKLVIDLGIKRTELFRIIQFYRLYPIVATVSRQLSWGHYKVVIALKDDRMRGFYENKAVQNSWSIRELRTQIKNNLYENTSPEEIKEVFKAKLPETGNLDVFKNEAHNYDLHFIEPSMNQKEKDIEDGIIKHIDLFLKEMGEGFAFVGRQVPIKMDGQTHYIDLVLFHKGIPCTVLVDLKNQKIDSRDIGQMNKYVSYWRNNCQYEYEKDAIGLVLCKAINKEEVAYALEDLEQKIFVATYQTKLPNEETVKNAVRKLS